MMRRSPLARPLVPTNHPAALSLLSGFSTRDFSFVFNGIAFTCVVGGIISIVLGYKLFVRGLDRGRGELDARVKFLKIVFKGAGPGLFFMAFGALILIVALLAGALGNLG